MNHDDAAMYENSSRSRSVSVTEEDSIDPPIIRDLKAMAIDLQNALKRIGDLEKSYRGLFHDYSHLENAIAELRARAGEQADHDERINVIEKIGAETRLLKIEKCFGAVINSGTTVRIGDKPTPKVPHKCPVCDGYGVHDNGHQCQACRGKSIVWG